MTPAAHGSAFLISAQRSRLADIDILKVGAWIAAVLIPWGMITVFAATRF